MSFCPQCGHSVADGVRFCPGCGAQQPQTQPAAPAAAPVAVLPQAAAARKLHCPNCRSTNIAITTESSVTGGLSTSRGNVTATSLSNVHRNYWICSDCGTKFRNIQNLEDELVKAKKSPIFVGVWFVLALIVTIFLVGNSMNNPIGGFIMLPFTFASGITALVTFIFIFVYSGRAKKLEQELAYLKENCFN